MKKNSLYFKSLLLLSSALLLTACSPSPTPDPPTNEYLNVSDIEIPGGNTTATLVIEANCQWVISWDGSSTWIRSISPTTGRENQNVTITVDVNPSSTQARTAVITVKSTSGKITRNITLTQSASSSYLNLSTDNTDGILDFSETAGSLDVSVFSNTNWTIEGVDDQWVSLSKTSGNGESKVRITVTANLNVKERKNVLTFKGDGVSPKQLTVRQAQATYHVTVSSPQVSNITSNTASITFSYDSNVAITSYGVCYSTTDNPNIESAQYVLKTGSTNQGSPTIQLTGLSPETLYYVRAFALMQNQTEVNYSEKSVSFSTTANEPGVNDNKTPEPIN